CSWRASVSERIYGYLTWRGATRSEKFPGEVGVEQVRPRSRRSMQDQHRLPGWRADRRVIQLQLGQHLACVKAKVPDYPLTLIWSRIICSPHRQSEQTKYKSARNTREYSDKRHAGLHRSTKP